MSPSEFSSAIEDRRLAVFETLLRYSGAIGGPLHAADLMRLAIRIEAMSREEEKPAPRRKARR